MGHGDLRSSVSAAGDAGASGHSWEARHTVRLGPEACDLPLHFQFGFSESQPCLWGQIPTVRLTPPHPSHLHPSVHTVRDTCCVGCQTLDVESVSPGGVFAGHPLWTLAVAAQVMTRSAVLVLTAGNKPPRASQH